MRKLPPKYLIAALIIAAVAAAAGLYHRYGSNTRVAFVNYPEYLLAPLMNQELNPAIEATPLRWTETSGEELKNYDMIIFFGMGLNFTEKQQQLLAALKKPLYVTASTRTETALNTLTGRQREEIAAYLGNGGKENFRRMLDYIRYEVDGKRLRAARPQPPKKIERHPFFHISEDDAFKTYQEYLAWYKKTGRYKENAATVCLLSGNGGGALEELIGALEKKGLNVVAANGMWNLLPMFEEVRPDLVVYQPHGRLGEKAVELLKKYNVPLFCPIKVSQPYEEYLRDQRGMTRRHVEPERHHAGTRRRSGPLRALGALPQQPRAARIPHDSRPSRALRRTGQKDDGPEAQAEFRKEDRDHLLRLHRQGGRHRRARASRNPSSTCSSVCRRPATRPARSPKRRNS